MTVVTDHPGARGPDAAPGPVPEDPYEALFRPADESMAAPKVDEVELAAVDAHPIEADPIEADPFEAVGVEPDMIESAPIASAPADRPRTGRLFRSAGAASVDGALPAISSSQASRLRTMVPASAPSAPPAPIESVVGLGAAHDVDAEVIDAVPVITMTGQPEAPVNARAHRSSRSVDREAASRGGRLTGMGVYALVLGVTVFAAFVNVLLFGPEINAITGIALAVVSVVSALLVRRADDVTAIIAPPLAFGLAAVTAAQVGLTTTTLANRFITAFFTLGNNWFWIIGSALAAMVIVAVRRRSR